MVGRTLLMIAAASVMAAPVHAAGWTGELTILSLNTESGSDAVYFHVAPNSSNLSGCATDTWMLVGASGERLQRAYATLLTAMTAGKKVRLWYQDDCTTWSYHAASTVKIMN